MQEQVKALKEKYPAWERAMYMLLFVFIYSVAEFVLAALVMVHFILVLLHGKPDEKLKNFGEDLSGFIYNVFMFLTYNSEEKPFPFKPWKENKKIT